MKTQSKLFSSIITLALILTAGLSSPALWGQEANLKANRDKVLNMFKERTVVMGTAPSATSSREVPLSLSLQIAPDGKVHGSVGGITPKTTMLVEGQLDAERMILTEVGVDEFEGLGNPEPTGSYILPLADLLGSKWNVTYKITPRAFAKIQFNLATATPDLDTPKLEAYRKQERSRMAALMDSGLVSMEGNFVTSGQKSQFPVKLSFRNKPGESVAESRSVEVGGILEFKSLGYRFTVTGTRNGAELVLRTARTIITPQVPPNKRDDYQQVLHRYGVWGNLRLVVNRPGDLLIGEGQSGGDLSRNRVLWGMRLDPKTMKLDEEAAKELASELSWDARRDKELQRTLENNLEIKGKVIWTGGGSGNRIDEYPVVLKLTLLNGNDVSGTIEWPTLKATKDLLGSLNNNAELSLVEVAPKPGLESLFSSKPAGSALVGIRYRLEFRPGNRLIGDCSHEQGNGFVIFE